MNWLNRFKWSAKMEPIRNGKSLRRRRVAMNRRRSILEQLEGRRVFATLASWDFSGESTVATSDAEVVVSNLDIGGQLTRGPGASASAGSNSFRTQGFQNNGISTANTDYFQTQLSASPGHSLSLSFIDARFAGTSTFAASPGVSHQFGYSLDGANFTLIDSPVVTVGTPATITGLDLTAIAALQDVPDTTTVTFRYYASGQTSTGGWGFNSATDPGTIGLLIDGEVELTGDPSAPTALLSPNVGLLNLSEGAPGASFDLSFSALPVSDVTVTITPSNSQIDLGAGAGSNLVLTFSSANAMTAQSFVVTAVDDAIAEGTHASGLAFAVTSSDSDFNSLVINLITVSISDNDFDSLVAPYTNDFESTAGTAGLGEGWSVFSVDTDTGRTWNAGTFSGDRFSQANSFGGSAPANDWLISPPFDLNATTNEVVNFETWTRFTDSGIADPEVRFLYSTNYSGVGDPTLSTWTELPYGFPAENTQVSTSSGNIDVSSINGTQVWFAFQYLSSGTGADSSASWQVDDFSLTVGTPPPTESSFVLINEILFDPPGFDTPSEYVELRGDAGTVIPAGTYLIDIEGDTSTGFPQGVGKVSNIFDLSGLAFGSNGYLVLAQNGNSYTFDSSANVLVSSTGDFGGFAFFQSDVGANEIENATNSLLLVSSPTAPALSDDVDSNNDGALDGALVSGWTLLDGVSVSDGDSSDQTYAPVVFAGASVGYVARLGNATGMVQGDWVGAAISGSAPSFTLAVGSTTPSSQEGEQLDHIGSENPALSIITPGAPVPFSESFETFTAAGFVTEPAVGQLDSDFWRVTGMTDAAGAFGGEFTAGDFARGASIGGVTSGGVYAFDTGGNVILGFQPTGSDFAPGTLTLKVTNTTGSTISDWTIGYDIFTLNNADRSSSLNFEYSTDDSTYIPVPAFDYTTPELTDASPAWVPTPRGTILTGVTVPDGGSLLLRWVSADVTGSGSRDEFGIDNISVTAGAPGPSISVTQSGGTTQVEEGGATDSVNIVLNSQPTANVTIAIASIGEEVTASPTSVTFTTENWNLPQAVVVTAVDDLDDEGTHSDQLSFTSTSVDGDYNGLTIPNLSVSISDNDAVAALNLLINEVMKDAPGPDTGNEYIEFRGTPGAVIPAGYYFLEIEGDNGNGVVDHVFNLEGLTIGANGFLVLAQAGSPYSFDPNSSVVTATGTGWESSWSSRASDLENGSATYMLIQSAVAPVQDEDVDALGNGVLTGSATSWTILDAIGILEGDSAADTAYAQTNFSNNGLGIVTAGGSIVNLSLLDVLFSEGYTPDWVGRNGDSTGSTASDWIAADVLGSVPTLSIDLAETSQSGVGGPLDHIGSANNFDTFAVLTLTFDQASISENGGSAIGTITRTGTTVGDLVVSLTASDSDSAFPDETAQPASVTILNGQATATFTINGVDDFVVDSNVIVRITASANNEAVPAFANIEVVDDDAVVIVTQSNGSTDVTEGGVTDTYQIALGSAPAGSVEITATATPQSELSLDGINFSSTVVLTYNSAAPQTVTVRAIDDTVNEGFHTSTISHAITASNDPNFSLSETLDGIVANITDNDTVDVTGLYLNEVLRNPPGSDTGNEYIELRGTPGGTIAAGTYIVVLEGDSGPGLIDHIFDLSNVTIGSNGYLVLLQDNNTYSVDPASAVLSADDGNPSTNLGWGTIFSSRTNDIENGSETVLLISSAAAPVSGADVDSQNNGTLSGPAIDWTILDGIGVLDGGASDTAYAVTNFGPSSAGLVGAGNSIIVASVTPQWVGRAGDTTGTGQSDWIASTTIGTSPAFSLESTFPLNIVGDLNHIGASNPYGTATGLTLNIDLSSVSENGGIATGTVTRSGDPQGDLVVTLLSSDTTEATVPFSVTIPEGELSATFTITAVNDSIIDGTQTVSITASAGGFDDVDETIDVLDDELPPSVVLAVTPEDIAEAGGVASVTATLSAVTTFEVQVNLTLSGTATSGVDYSVPGLVITIPAGSLTGSINVTALNDSNIEGIETIVVDINTVANAVELGQQQVTVNIVDDDNATPPAVESVSINGGDTTRSNITNITVAFDTEIDHAQILSAFTLTNIDTNQAVGSLVVTPTVEGGKTVVVLTFGSGLSVIDRVGTGMLGNSLADGNYRLDILATKVKAVTGSAAMLADYVFGGQSAGQPDNDDFFRLYGDTSGDGFVDGLDFNEFLATFANPSNFNGDFDSNGDGFIDGSDLNDFLPAISTSRQ